MNKQLADAVAELKELQAWLAVAQEREKHLRQFIAVRLVPLPKEGMNHVVMEGLEATIEHKLYRKVNAELLARHEPMLTKAKMPLGELIRYQPDLVLRRYRQLTEGQQHMFDRVLVITPGTPVLKIN